MAIEMRKVPARRLVVLLAALVGACIMGLAQAAVTFAGPGPAILGAIPITSCAAISNTALSTTHEVVFAANAGRKWACLSNNDASIAIYVAFHTTATSADIRVAAGQTICEDIQGGWVYTGVIDALAASGTPAIGGVECQ